MCYGSIKVHSWFTISKWQFYLTIFNVYQKKKCFFWNFNDTVWNYMKPKKTMNAYLAQKIYHNEEFEDYIKAMGDEFLNEIKNYSTEICFKIIIIFIKKPVNVYSITSKCLIGNNIHKFFEKYDRQYKRCLGIIDSCLP